MRNQELADKNIPVTYWFLVGEASYHAGSEGRRCGKLSHYQARSNIGISMIFL